MTILSFVDTIKLNDTDRNTNLTPELMKLFKPVLALLVLLISFGNEVKAQPTLFCNGCNPVGILESKIEGEILVLSTIPDSTQKFSVGTIVAVGYGGERISMMMYVCQIQENTLYLHYLCKGAFQKPIGSSYNEPMYVSRTNIDPNSPGIPNMEELCRCNMAQSL